MARWVLFFVVALSTTVGLFILWQQMEGVSLPEVLSYLGLLGILAGMLAVGFRIIEADLMYSRVFLNLLGRDTIISQLKEYAEEMEELFDEETSLERKKRSLGDNFKDKDRKRLAALKVEIRKNKKIFWMLHRQVLRAKIDNLPATIKGYAEWGPGKEPQQPSEVAEIEVGPRQPAGGLQY